MKLFLIIMVALVHAGQVFTQSSWQALLNAPFRTGRHEDIFFVNPSTGWVVNLAGEIFKTRDGGLSWELQFFFPSAGFRSVWFADSLRGLAGTLAGPLLWRTSDGGESWIQVTNIPEPVPAGICGISAVGRSIYASGRFDGPAVVIKSTDGGFTWSSIDMSAYANTLVDCYFFSPDSGFVVGGSADGEFPDSINAIILFTPDGGATWETRHQTERTGEWCWKMTFPTPDTGYVAIETSNDQAFVLKTVDGGLNWEDKFVGNDLEIQGIGFANGRLGWVGTHFNRTNKPFMTTDGGETWEEVDFGINCNRFRMLNDTLGYAVGQTVYKYTSNRDESFTEIDAPLLGLAESDGAAFGDYDNDADLDLLVCGIDESGTGHCIIYRNDDGVFVDISAGLTSAPAKSAKWGDYDNDNDLDILFGNGRLYRNDNGIFADISVPFLTSADGVSEFIDYDNDGDLDVFIAGNHEGTYFAKIYRNDDDSFTDISAALTAVSDAAAAWGDYDNDGDHDLLLSGKERPGNVTPLLKIYRNDHGDFIAIPNSLSPVVEGSAAWGDYDNDGDLDVLLAGTKLGQPAERILKVYRNDIGTFANASFQVDESTEHASWGDYDNDGDLDILQFGTRIYRNDQNDNFTDTLVPLRSTDSGSAVFGDYDNDSDLDIFLDGETINRTFRSGVYQNNINTANNPPTAPANLLSTVAGDSVILQWQKSTDQETPRDGLTYNLRMGTTPGGVEVVAPMADLATGYRKIVAIGNVSQNTSWVVRNLPEGRYYWSVQAIDHAFAGSAFSQEQMFVIGLASSIQTSGQIVEDYWLAQNHPNPFNPSTTIRYALPNAAHVVLRVFNLFGQEVKTLVNQEQQAGFKTVIWNGTTNASSPAASGIYIYRLQAGKFERSYKMLLIR